MQTVKEEEDDLSRIENDRFLIEGGGINWDTALIIGIGVSILSMVVTTLKME
ncbi:MULTISPECIES: hypothetical protein [Actinomycetes]|jgi:hypothetical protein|uniref:hypothetical protein n=1 Tax=Actinomycetes TaxID=1760 RepID=UPI002648A948|nr:MULTISPECIES: hypothetical protein [Actinomycetes]MDN5973382.1 hypothetical protein [Bifidobacterium crudilactis]MDN6274222.1 hypothetical protein [Corynebacterium casei]MDN6424791.1 hypothetical protein [Bifidobacterium crudilactis]MDN6468179.1 hypothetical protein [Bifidobacterium crudilactis]MDN6587426.1 hypothetical protein [Bifidobacterium crudilactis]